MVEGLTELITTFLKWALRIYIGIILFGLYANLITTVTSAIGSITGSSVLNEVALFIQVWLPFNLSTVFNWLMTATMTMFLYFAYKYVYGLIYSMTGR